MNATTPIALCDLNSAFVNMETLFKPWLREKACATLAMNDGCVIARNAPCKALGIKMGQPWHEVRHFVDSGQLTIFSSNFSLYQSISDRAHTVLSEASSRIQNYSIDEWFLDPTGAGDDLEGWAIHTRQELLTRVGVPSGIGIGPTKTLAKLANYAAKNWAPATGWVVNLMDPKRQQRLLAIVEIEEVWGIGSRFAKRLRKDVGITTALGLAQADKRWLRRQYGVVVERTARELCGERCFAFSEVAGKKQRIAATRAFGERVTDVEGLRSAVATHASTVAEKLRRQNSLATVMVVFAHSSPFSSTPFQRGQAVIELPYPTDDTRELVAKASQAVKQFFKPGVSYAKAGVILHQIVDADYYTKDLFQPEERRSSKQVMQAMDAINARLGRHTVRLALTQRAEGWKMRQQFLSPRYTTRWEDLPVCH